MKILKEFIKFIGISGVGWLIDFTIYNILSGIFKVNIDIANMISSLIGVTFVFLVSTRKLFFNNSKINLKIKYLIYIIYQLLLIFLASKVILLVKAFIINLDIYLLVKYVSVLAKIIITPFTMIINYFAMKYLIEKL